VAERRDQGGQSGNFLMELSAMGVGGILESDVINADRFDRFDRFARMANYANG